MSTSLLTNPFLCSEPDPKLARELELFGQFVGSWDVDVVNHLADGSRQEVPAEWHFAWALGGHAVQDVWIAPRRSAGGGGEWGTTLRFYDPELGAWRSTWHGPRKQVVMPFIGRRDGDEIVLEGSFEDRVVTRWIFFDVAPDSFRWRAVDSTDDGATWRLRQEMTARRA
jgi:hypothetical protein